VKPGFGGLIQGQIYNPDGQPFMISTTLKLKKGCRIGAVCALDAMERVA